jgi:hypothetical protein
VPGDARRAEGSKLCKGIKQRSYPVVEKSGILWAYLGEGEPPAFPEIDCFVAPDSHTFAFKGHINCNWLQALEVGIDPAHASFLHRFFEDEDTSTAYGKQFRGASAGSDMPMTKILREYDNPIINVEHTEYGLRLIALREIDEERTHVRVTNQLFPHGFVIPMSTEMTITQWHVPVDDENCYWYAIFTSYTRRSTRRRCATSGSNSTSCRITNRARTSRNDYGFDPHEQATETYTGMGADINVHDQWAVESMGAIQDRTNEHLGTSTRRSCNIAACCGRRSKRSPAARSRSCSSTPRMRAASRARRPWTASGRRAAGKSTGWKSTSSAAAARRGPRRCRARSPTRSGICRRRSDVPVIASAAKQSSEARRRLPSRNSTRGAMDCFASLLAMTKFPSWGVTR